MNANNPFFKIALGKAAKLLGKPGRMLALVVDLSKKLRDVDWKNVSGSDVKNKFFVMGRMMKAYATGEYRDIPWKSLLMIAAALIYFINPIDLIPDWIPGVGMTDDIGILMMVAKKVTDDLDRFVLWEKSKVISIDPL